MADEGGGARPAEHQYPSEYGRGIDPVLNQAWDILDTIKPGVIPTDVRAWLAAQITSILTKHLEKVQVRVPPLEEALDISPKFYSQFIAAKNMAMIGFLTMGEESFSATLSGVTNVIRQHMTLEQAQQLLRGFAMTMPDVDKLEKDASTEGVNADHE